MGKIRGFGNIKKIRELINKMDFHSSKGFVIYTNKVDEKRIGDILMGRLKYLDENGKMSGTTKEEVIKYMQEKFAIGGINDFVNFDQILECGLVYYIQFLVYLGTHLQIFEEV